VVWLNEAQFYLEVTDGGLGERVAAGPRELLRDPSRAPMLVLATLWPQYWDTLTARPPGGADPHAQARELLAGHDIPVPTAFTPAQLGELAGSGDVRLELAGRLAADGQVIQFLAGAPELLARYRNAPPAAAALISAAMDARRLGMGAGLPHAFLEAAAPGYLTGGQWDALGEDWLEQALAYAAVPCMGARGPLTRRRRRPAASRAPRSGPRDRGEQRAGGPGDAGGGGPLYRLADYLDQHGRQHRKGQIPPPEFWAAAAAHASPADQAALGDSAHNRGLYRDAAQLHKNAAAHGNLRSALYLSDPRTACARMVAPRTGPPPMSPSTTRTAWPACWAGCGRRARPGRPSRWPAAPLPTPSSATRTAWPACWTSCGRRARKSRPPRWPAAPLPTSPSATRAPQRASWAAVMRERHHSGLGHRIPETLSLSQGMPLPNFRGLGLQGVETRLTVNVGAAGGGLARCRLPGQKDRSTQGAVARPLGGDLHGAELLGGIDSGRHRDGG